MIFNFPEGEVLFINKPLKWTSFDVVGKIRVMLKYRLGIKKIKVGHAGTLDPLATGLLIVCTGKFTKKIDEYQGMDKVYSGTFVLGGTTPSYDLETEVSELKDTSAITIENIYKTAESFVGVQLQEPPIYSAVKMEGKRAYEMAREGKVVKMNAKLIEIKTFEITGIEMPRVHFRICCSKGTYIRALARDFGERLGCGAYLSELCRTRIGDYSLDDALSVEQFEGLLEQLKK